MHLFPNVRRAHTTNEFGHSFCTKYRGGDQKCHRFLYQRQVCACRRFLIISIVTYFYFLFLLGSCLLCSPNDCIACASAGPETDSTSVDDTTSMSKKASDVWSLLSISIKRSRKVRGGNYVQLATVDNKGNPACRTVVFRGFLDVGTAEHGTEMAMVCVWLYFW